MLNVKIKLQAQKRHLEALSSYRLFFKMQRMHERRKIPYELRNSTNGGFSLTR